MTDEQEKAVMDKITNCTCKFIAAELESIREEINLFIDNLIEEKIKNYIEQNQAEKTQD